MWDERRETTHEQDRVYLSLGISNIHMPSPLYGEGIENLLKRMTRVITDFSEDAGFDSHICLKARHPNRDAKLSNVKLSNVEHWLLAADRLGSYTSTTLQDVFRCFKQHLAYTAAYFIPVSTLHRNKMLSQCYNF